MTRRIVIFGAGMAGLAAARELGQAGYEVHVYEAADRIGGLAASFEEPDGIHYDFGPHFIFSSLARSLGIEDTCVALPYYEDIFLDGCTYRFPFGLMRRPHFVASLGLTYLRRPFAKPFKHLEEFFETFYGGHVAREVLIPLIEKWSGVPSQELSLDMAHRFLPPSPSYLLYSLIKWLRGGATEDYYKRGRVIVAPTRGCISLFRALLTSNNITVHLSAPLTSLAVSGNRLEGASMETTSNDQRLSVGVEADAFVSTIPLPFLSRLLHSAATEPWERLQYRGLRLLVLKLARPRVLRHLWTWFPEPNIPFYRIAEYPKFQLEHTCSAPSVSPYSLSSGACSSCTVISIELGYDPPDAIHHPPCLRIVSSHPTGNQRLGDPSHSAPNKTLGCLLEEVWPFLERLYDLKTHELLSATLLETPAAYPVLLCKTEPIHRALSHRTPFENLFLAGRTGLFRYIMLEGAYKSGISAARTVLAFLEGRPLPEPDSVARDRYGVPLLLPE